VFGVPGVEDAAAHAEPVAPAKSMAVTPEPGRLDVAVALRKKHGGAAFTLVVLSGYSSDDYRSDAFEAGFNDYFAKPLVMGDFLNFLSTVGP
jgi:DNA-binding response OmpR family regulator